MKFSEEDHQSYLDEAIQMWIYDENDNHTEHWTEDLAAVADGADPRDSTLPGIAQALEAYLDDEFFADRPAEKKEVEDLMARVREASA